MYTATSNKSKEVVYENIEITDQEVVLGCNNGAIPSYENEVVTISNLEKDATCTFYNSLITASTNIDESMNYLILLQDEIFDNKRVTFTYKNVHLDLYGHIIFYNPKTLSAGYALSFTGGTYLLESSKLKGGIIVNALEDTTSLCQDAVQVFRKLDANTEVDILSGYYYSNSSFKDCATIQASGVTGDYNANFVTNINIRGEKAENCTENIENYTTGLCIYGVSSAALKNNGGSYGNINIYGGSVVSKNYNAYMTDAPGGSTNIYGGYFESSNASIITLGSSTKNTTVNICGGEFNSPYDINATAANIMVYYKSVGMTWYNNTISPTITGTYSSNVILNNNDICN